MHEREPAVAGQFYEYSAASLKKEIENCFLKKVFGPGELPAVSKGQRKIVGIIVPHAGFVYSGAIASNSYFQLASDGRPESFVIIGPNHTGMGTAVSVMDEGIWKTPLGRVKIDAELAKKILEGSAVAEKDATAHFQEHSVEVQLPFIQYVFKNFQFVPVCMMDQNYEACLDLGNSIAGAISNRNAVIIASSDFTHFESNEVAHRKDKKALDAIEKMDAKKFLETVEYENMSVCGYGPIASMLIAAKKLKAKSCEILRYATSGDVTGDENRVVGYAAAKVVK
jgi:AmmeMemoRadiSam system protein B